MAQMCRRTTTPMNAREETSTTCGPLLCVGGGEIGTRGLVVEGD